MRQSHVTRRRVRLWLGLSGLIATWSLLFPLLADPPTPSAASPAVAERSPGKPKPITAPAPALDGKGTPAGPEETQEKLEGKAPPATEKTAQPEAGNASDASTDPSARGNRIMILRLEGGIFSGTTDYVLENVHRAEAAGMPVLLVLDTPGGALDATRDLVKAFLGARVPILVWVGPAGARAGSAGVFITMAAHVAGMAPGTNIGAAHPVGIGVGAPRDKKEDQAQEGEGRDRPRSDDEVMAQKVENDTVAFIESIATARHRNVDWAISAVRDSVSVTAEKALELKVVDFLAKDVDTFLLQADGREVETLEGKVTLSTARAERLEVPMNLRQRVLAFLGDPNLVYVLFAIGMLAIYLEMSHPGAIAPAVVGGLCLILALTGLSVLPYNATGVIFLILAFVCFVAEVYVQSMGLLALGGAACLVLGAVLLFDQAPDLPALKGLEVGVSPWVYGSVALFSLALVLPVAWLVARAQLRRVVSGQEGLIGAEGKALTPITSLGGRAFVHGEYWEARSPTPIPVGAMVQVVALKELQLEVRMLDAGGAG